LVGVPDRSAIRPSGGAGFATGLEPSRLRGADELVAVSWEELTELLASELRRVDTHGNEAIYGGSYGWPSAGRFHTRRVRCTGSSNSLAGIPFHDTLTASARPGGSCGG
jgi:anaerobic selenocysteine-containing dehydrogenase